MKCKIPEISWHNRDPVLSVDIQPTQLQASSSLSATSNDKTNCYRLASGGTDAHVLIWYIKLITGENNDIELDLAADLTRHQRAVNCVKWSPSGELLASGDDESVVFIWKLKGESETVNILDDANDNDKEVWITLKVLRGHMEDIYDLSWSPNSMYLVSGSVDNSAIMWDVHKGKSMAILNDHKGFVQGVSWDPKNQYIATLSTDRFLRIFDIQSKKVVHRISKATLPVAEDHSLYGKRMRIFHDDTLQTFFRRLTFSPDGKLLLTPAGVTDYEGCTQPLHTTYIFSRYGLRQPAIVLPCPDQYTVAIQFSPKLYKLRKYDIEKNPPVVPLAYRMIFAVATKSSVYFYDTQQKQPFAVISNIHYTRLSDITWSNDGRVVVVSSTDGFCSLITFDEGELGEEYEDSQAVLEAALAQVNNIKKTAKKQKDSLDSSQQKSRKASIDDAAVNKDQTQKEISLQQISEEENSVSKTKIVVVESKQNTDPKASPNIKQTNAGQQEHKSKVVENDEIGNQAQKKEGAIPTPIAIKRKPATNSDTKTDTSKYKPAMPIAIKRKPGPVKTTKEEIETDVTLEDTKDTNTTPSKITTGIPSKVLAAEIIIDKEILSSDEKFESPEKKSRPATPISVRRHPRTPSSTTPTSIDKIFQSNANSPLSSLTKPTKTTKQDKKATPIAVRRTPRPIISAPIVMETPSLLEEAMDAWPSKDKNTNVDECKQSLKEEGIIPLPSEITGDRTEDIRLVYEETNEEAPTNLIPTKEQATKKSSLDCTTPLKNENSKAVLPTEKTPRRVALKTISTPKSKKKLLD